MAVVRWTPQARADLLAIETYFLDVAPAYAEVAVDGIVAATRRLETFPLSGRAVPEVGDPAIREVIWRDYRILHWADDEQVDVLAVLPVARPLDEPPRRR